MLPSIIALVSVLVLLLKPSVKGPIKRSQVTYLVLFLHIQNQILLRSVKKVKLTEPERFLLSRLAKRLSSPLLRKYLLIVRPDTIASWHRRLGSYFHAVRSQLGKFFSSRKKSGAPLKYPEIMRILKNNAALHPEWGIWKHFFELSKLGFGISSSTTARYLRQVPEYQPRLLRLRELWKSFLENKKQKIAAMDFFQFRLFNFKSIYIFFIIEHDRRKILHWNMTFHPTEDWVCRQLTATFDLNEKYSYLIFDRDAIFSRKVRGRIKQLGLKEKRITPRSPWQNGIAERWVQTVKFELIYRKAFWNLNNSHRLMKEYVNFYNTFRPHRGLDGDSPLGRPVQNKPAPNACIEAVSHCDGLHTHYGWRSAA